MVGGYQYRRVLVYNTKITYIWYKVLLYAVHVAYVVRPCHRL